MKNVINFAGAIVEATTSIAVAAVVVASPFIVSAAWYALYHGAIPL